MKTDSRKPLRILCVDDEPSIRMLVSMYLQRLGHAAEVAADGLEAWEKISETPVAFDVVVTDFEMPNLGGLGLVQLLRESNFQGKIIVFSSSLSPRDKENFQQLGVDAVLEKAGPVKDLMEEIQSSAKRGDDVRNSPRT